MDCDGSLDPRELPAVAAPVLAGAADLVARAPAGPSPGAWPLHARVANRALALELRRRTGVRAAATSAPCARPGARPCSGWASRDRRFGWPLEMVLRAAEAGWRDRARSTCAYRARAGRSKVTGTVRGTRARRRATWRWRCDDRAGR